MFEHIITYYTHVESQSVRAHNWEAADEAYITARCYCDSQDGVEPYVVAEKSAPEVPAWRAGLNQLPPLALQGDLNGTAPCWR